MEANRVKLKFSFPLILILILWACAPAPQPVLTPPPFPLESLPPALTVTMSLQERVVAEEAWRHVQQGDLKAAEKVLQRLPPHLPSSNLINGFINLIRNNNQEAVNKFKQTLEALPSLSLARAGLAQAYLNLGDKPAAFDSLREVLKDEPENEWARKNFRAIKEELTENLRQTAREALKTGNLERARQSLLEALHYSPEATDLHLSLVKIYRERNDLESALTHLKAAVDLAPRNRDLLLNYAETLLEAKQYSRAFDTLEQALELSPGDKEIQAKLAELKEKLGIVDLPSQYEAIPRLEAISREDLASLIAIKFKKFLPPLSDSPPIIVDIATSWASRFIVQTAAAGFLDVYSDHTFRPKNIITRAEMAECLTRMLHFFQNQGKKIRPLIPPEKILLPDVSPEHAYYPSIIEAVAYQLMELRPDKRFDPEGPVSGREAIKMLEVLLALVQ